MTNHTRHANTLAGLMTIAAVGTTLYAAAARQAWQPLEGLTLLALAAATSRMKVKLPGLNGTMSVNLPFLLYAAVHLSAIETALIAAACGLVQSWPKSGAEWKPVQASFNVSMMVLAMTLTSLLFHAKATLPMMTGPLGLAIAGLSVFLGQTVPVSAVIALTEGAVLRRVWIGIAHLSFPYYVASVGMATLMEQIHRNLGLLLAMTAVAVMYGIYRSYRTYFQTAAEPAPALRYKAAHGGV